MDYIYYSILLIAGFLLLFHARDTLQLRIRFLRKGRITTARVVHIIVKVVDDENGRKAYTPVFRYTTATNESYTYESPLSYGADDHWTVGNTIKLAYDSNDPQQVLLLTYEHAFGLAGVLLGIATLLIIAGSSALLTSFFLNRL